MESFKIKPKTTRYQHQKVKFNRAYIIKVIKYAIYVYVRILWNQIYHFKQISTFSQLLIKFTQSYKKNAMVKLRVFFFMIRFITLEDIHTCVEDECQYVFFMLQRSFVFDCGITQFDTINTGFLPDMNTMTHVRNGQGNGYLSTGYDQN